MSVCYFVAYYPGQRDPGAFIDYYLTGHAPLVKDFPEIRRLEILTPAQGDDPLLREEEGPVLVAQMTFDTVSDLEAAVVSDARMKARDDVANFPPFDGAARHQAMTYEPFPLEDGNDDAPTVYHVQYHRPAPDEEAFVSYYRRHHPPILALFPGIRKVAIYTPLEWNDASFITRNDLMLVNEVAFDSEPALNASLASDVRLRAREDYNSFPPFEGPVSHTPMHRHVLLS